MKKNKIDEQRKIIKSIYCYFKKNKLKSINEYSFFLEKKINEIIMLESSVLNKNQQLKIEYIYDIHTATQGFFSYNSDGTLLKITLNLAGDGFSDLKNDDVEVRLVGCSSILKTILHEIKHLNQYLLCSSKYSNKYALKYAKEFISQQADHGLYKKNHDNFSVEADADIYGYSFVSDYNFPQIESDKETSNFIIQSNSDSENAILEDRDTYLDYMTFLTISTNADKNYCVKFPILLKEYNEDGSRKKLITLIYNMENELEQTQSIVDKNSRNRIQKEIKEMYYEIFNSKFNYLKMDIIQNELNEVCNTYGIEYISSLFQNIKKYNDSELKNKSILLSNKFRHELKYESSKRYINKYSRVLTKENNFISTGLYARNNNFGNDSRQRMFFRSAQFISRIPFNGYVVLKDNNISMDFNTFVKKYVYDFVNRLTSFSNLANKYDEFLDKLIYPYFLNDYEYNLNKEEKKRKKYCDGYDDLLEKLKNNKTIKP